jgi:hypothetical protein
VNQREAGGLSASARLADGAHGLDESPAQAMNDLN